MVFFFRVLLIKYCPVFTQDRDLIEDRHATSLEVLTAIIQTNDDAQRAVAGYRQIYGRYRAV